LFSLFFLFSCLTIDEESHLRMAGRTTRAVCSAASRLVDLVERARGERARGERARERRKR
jgi:hypothetical protein